MATADEYAAWIVKNADKKGTPEFDTVATAYQDARKTLAAAPSEWDTTTGPQIGMPPQSGIPVGRKSGMFDFMSAPFEMGQT